MANYSINLTDNSDGSYTVSAVKRAPATVASGGTELKTTYADAASSNTWLALEDAIFRAAMFIMTDKRTNG